jgi:glycosyltransferase involved in cell wall biosynthesis
MRIFTALTYYLPHISGLTIFASRLNRLLAADGYRITVLTSRFTQSLPRNDTDAGAAIVRSPVLLRISKGALMPLLPWHAFQLARKSDVVFLHLPQFEASLVAIYAKLLRKPVVLQYQCDIVLPSWRARLVFALPIRISHAVACLLADRIVVITEDYARSSKLLRRFLNKTTWVYPPIELPAAEPEVDIRKQYGLGDGPVIGFVGRLAEEKGIDTLVEALTLVRQTVPDVKLAMVGPTDAAPGERRAHARLMSLVEANSSVVVHLGVLTDRELTAFYREIDVLAVPSTNSTESFGMTQAEAMLAGTPAVASDLPGVREAIRATGMGEVVQPGNAHRLAAALVRVLSAKERYIRPEAEIRATFDPTKTATFYADLFDSLAPQAARRSASSAAVADERSVAPAKRS